MYLTHVTQLKQINKSVLTRHKREVNPGLCAVSSDDPSNHSKHHPTRSFSLFILLHWRANSRSDMRGVPIESNLEVASGQGCCV